MADAVRPSRHPGLVGGRRLRRPGDAPASARRRLRRRRRRAPVVARARSGTRAGRRARAGPWGRGADVTRSDAPGRRNGPPRVCRRPARPRPLRLRAGGRDGGLGSATPAAWPGAASRVEHRRRVECRSARPSHRSPDVRRRRRRGRAAPRAGCGVDGRRRCHAPRAAAHAARVDSRRGSDAADAAMPRARGRRRFGRAPRLGRRRAARPVGSIRAVGTAADDADGTATRLPRRRRRARRVRARRGLEQDAPDRAPARRGRRAARRRNRSGGVAAGAPP